MLTKCELWAGHGPRPPDGPQVIHDRSERLPRSSSGVENQGRSPLEKGATLTATTAEPGGDLEQRGLWERRERGDEWVLLESRRQWV